MRTAPKAVNSVPPTCVNPDRDPSTRLFRTHAGHTMGYLHITLAWMRQWSARADPEGAHGSLGVCPVRSWETRARIVMEKTHFWPRLVEPLEWLQPPTEAGPPAKAWQHCWLDFLVAHQDWRGLAAWVRSLPFSVTDYVDEEGKSCVDLDKLEQRGLRFCSSYAREVLLQQLGRRGIFCSGDTRDFNALLCRLTLCGKLFGDGVSEQKGEVTLASKLPSSESDEGALPLDRLLPVGRVSPFHCFFINYCIDNEARIPWLSPSLSFSLPLQQSIQPGLCNASGSQDLPALLLLEPQG